MDTEEMFFTRGRQYQPRFAISGILLSGYLAGMGLLVHQVPALYETGCGPRVACVHVPHQSYGWQGTALAVLGLFVFVVLGAAAVLVRRNRGAPTLSRGPSARRSGLPSEGWFRPILLWLAAAAVTALGAEGILMIRGIPADWCVTGRSNPWPCPPAGSIPVVFAAGGAVGVLVAILLTVVRWPRRGSEHPPT